MPADGVTSNAGSIRIVLSGPFRMEGADGTDLTPKSAKSIGLIALLASHPQARRSRSWLQSRLWSDRGREQASASLRQALSQLRRGLGDHGDMLTVNRAFVALKFDRIEVIRDPQGPEFLEGLDLRDAAFEDWMRAERRGMAPPPDVTLRQAQTQGQSPALKRSDLIRNVYVQAQTTAQGPERLFEEMFIDCFERWVSEALICQVHRGPPEPHSGNPILVTVQSYAAGGKGFGLRLSIEESQTRRTLWSGRKVIEAQGAPPVDHVDFLSLVHETTEALADGLVLRFKRTMDAADAAILGRMSLHKIFSMNVGEVDHADQLLQKAYDLDPRAIFLSWRGQLRIIQEMERHAGSADRRGEIEEFTRAAMRQEPTNSMVLSVAANAQLLIEDDVHAGLELARRAVSQNPANPFAWDAMSIGLAMSGRAQEAHLHQLRAFAISQKSPIRHFWDMGACLTSVATDKLEQARKLAHNASVMVPDFRPPLRYMAALDAAAGDTKAAQKSIEKLRKLEPDFTLKRMVEDEEYPVAGLRRAGILSKDKLGDLT